jgi:outer membrane lipoprotein LolB
VRRIFCHTLLVLGFLSLGGCSSLPFFSDSAEQTNEPPAYRDHLKSLQSIQAFSLGGRIGVVTEKKGFSGRLQWHHNQEGDQISLYSPFGAKVGEISANASVVTLITSEQKTYIAHNAETLTYNVLGWSLPLAGLSDWVLGRPAAGDAEVQSWFAGGLIARMRQSGWDIEFLSYRKSDGLLLPGKITLKSPKLDLKLFVETWQTDSTANETPP